MPLSVSVYVYIRMGNCHVMAVMYSRVSVTNAVCPVTREQEIYAVLHARDIVNSIDFKVKPSSSCWDWSTA